MAAVTGLPREDEPGSEYAKASIVLKPDATATLEQLLEWAKTRMAGYKRPRQIEIADSPPLTQVGKALRRASRQGDGASRQTGGNEEAEVC